MKSNPSTPVKGAVNRDASMVPEDLLKFYKDSGLEPLAREVRNAKKNNTVCLRRQLCMDLMHEQYKAYLNLPTIASNMAIYNSWQYFPQLFISYGYDLFSSFLIM